MQIRLSDYNKQRTIQFIELSTKNAPGFKINPTAIVNVIYAEGIRRELKRFERKKP